MAKHSIELLKNEALYAKMSAAAYTQACNFSIEKVLPQYEALYQRAFL
jgi:glycosyltransferase involved in cell wall biosynthesis